MKPGEVKERANPGRSRPRPRSRSRSRPRAKPREVKTGQKVQSREMKSSTSAQTVEKLLGLALGS